MLGKGIVDVGEVARAVGKNPKYQGLGSTSPDQEYTLANDLSARCVCVCDWVSAQVTADPPRAN